jgi:hypothetical protein
MPQAKICQSRALPRYQYFEFGFGLCLPQFACVRDCPPCFFLPQMFGGILLDGVEGIPAEARGNITTFFRFMKSNQHVVAIQVC